MTDSPIPFSAPMVAALRAGTKVQTRRVLNPQPEPEFIEATIGRDEMMLRPALLFGGPTHGMLRRLARPGSRMWVRESYYQRGHWAPVDGAQTKGGRQKWAFVPDSDEIRFDEPSAYRRARHADDPATVIWHKRLGRFMPRAASRMTLVVTDVRVQRLQDISEADAIAEGITPLPSRRYHCGFDDEGEITCKSPVTAYANLWNRINGEGAWMNNPWVVAYSFTVERRNIDAEG